MSTDRLNLFFNQNRIRLQEIISGRKTETRLGTKLTVKYPRKIHTRTESYSSNKIFQISYFY